MFTSPRWSRHRTREHCLARLGRVPSHEEAQRPRRHFGTDQLLISSCTHLANYANSSQNCHTFAMNSC
jgi:hypothetical protein